MYQDFYFTSSSNPKANIFFLELFLSAVISMSVSVWILISNGNKEKEQTYFFNNVSFFFLFKLLPQYSSPNLNVFTWNTLGWLSVQFPFKPISRIPSDVNERENEAWLCLSLPALCSFFLFLLRYFTWFLNEMTSDHAVCLPTFTPMSAFKPSD